MTPLVASLIVLGGLAGIVAALVVCSGVDEELDAAIADFFELSDTEVNDRFNDIVASYGERLIPHSEDVFDVEEGGL